MFNYKLQSVSSVDNLYDKFSSKEFKSPFRSTIPLLIMLRNNQIPAVDVDNKEINEIPTLTLEHETLVVSGKGFPSCTDLMIEYKNSCIAVESKRTEPPYQTVEKWLGVSKNKKLVLSGWLSIINSQINSSIKIEDVNSLPYQLIHRVAAACALKKIDTHVLYLGFDLDVKKENYYINSLLAFSKILKNKIKLHLHCYSINKFESQIELEYKWNNKERDLSTLIKNGLLKNNLMSLTEVNKYKINDFA